MRPVPRVQPVGRAIGQARNAAVGRAASRALLGHANQIAGRIARLLERPPPRQLRAESGLEQQLVGHGRRPRHLLHARADGAEVAADFGRRRGGEAAEAERADHHVTAGLLPAAFRGLVVGRAVAGQLLVPVDVELVLRRRLVGQSQRTDGPALRALSRLQAIRRIEELRRVAGVEVREDVRDRAPLALIADREEVPQAVLLDRTANTAGVVPLFDERARRGEPTRPELVAVVAADPPVGHAGEVDRSAHHVATRLGHDAQRRAADLGLAKAAGRGHHDLLRVGDVGGVGRHAAAVEGRANVQAVDLQPALVSAPARAAEHGHLRGDLDVGRRAALGLNRRNQDRCGGP